MYTSEHSLFLKTKETQQKTLLSFLEHNDCEPNQIEIKTDIIAIDYDHLHELGIAPSQALGVQPKSLESVIKRIEDENDNAFVWMFHHGGSSGTSSIASIISDVATTGTTISASYGGDGGGGAGAGGGAGGGGGGGAG